MVIPDTVEEALWAKPPLESEDPHYCLTSVNDLDLPTVALVDHPLNAMTELGIDPFMAYGVFQCPVCHSWWGNWSYRSAERDLSDWQRFGSAPPTVPHRDAL